MDKQALRERIWDDLEESGAARFPYPPHDRIPNFAGADEAADRLASVQEWLAAETLKSNPDAPQLPVRRRALAEGRIVYLAVPRLREADCFRELDPGRIADTDEAATIGGAADLGKQVGPDALPHVDLVVVGSVAVTENGARVGKGEGYSDLEWAILAESGLVDNQTTVVTTVHERQVVERPVTVEAHDVPIDVVVTPERVVRTKTPHSRPDSVDWDIVSPERYEAIPVLERLRE